MKLSNRQIQRAFDYYDAEDDDEPIDDSLVDEVEGMCNQFADKVEQKHKPKKIRGEDEYFS